MSEDLPQYSIEWNNQAPEPETTAVTVLEDKAWFEPGGSPGAWMNAWQTGLDSRRSAPKDFNAVYACRKVLAEEVSRLGAYHYRLESDGGKTKLNSVLTRILRYPNTFQTNVDFWLNMMDSLLVDGNAYALATRDARGAITALTPLRSAVPHIDPETGAIFYGVGLDLSVPYPEGQDPDPKYLIPQREVFHLRLFTPVNLLVGESPLVAAVVAAQTGQAISGSSFSFFNRAARPSGYLRHPKRISPQARDRLKDAWTTNYSGAGTGGTAVLEEGIEWAPMTMSAVDAEIVEQYGLQIEDIARVYRVPLFMLGSMDKATFSNVEQMTRSFYAGGLAFYLELIEAQLSRFFDLPMNEYVEFDIEGGLMRAEFGDRIAGITKGIQGGLFTVNEGRKSEGLPAVANGDAPLVQQQMVSLEYAMAQKVEEPKPEPVAAPEPEPEQEEPVTEEAFLDAIDKAFEVLAA
jgi:HK97 family phage portal protein